MTASILFCNQCRLYTLKQACPSCNRKTLSRDPPKFSPDDRHVGLIRQAKHEDRKSKGLI